MRPAGGKSPSPSRARNDFSAAARRRERTRRQSPACRRSGAPRRPERKQGERPDLSVREGPAGGEVLAAGPKDRDPGSLTSSKPCPGTQPHRRTWQTPRVGNGLDRSDRERNQNVGTEGPRAFPTMAETFRRKADLPAHFAAVGPHAQHIPGAYPVRKQKSQIL